MNTKLAKNSVIFFIGTGISAFAGLIASFIYNRTFPPEILGKYNLVNATFAVFYAFLCGWIASSFFRYYLEYKSNNRQIQLFNVIFTILLSLNIFLLLILFAIYRLAATSEYILMILIFAFNILPRCMVELFNNRFKLDNTMKGYLFLTALNSFGTLAVSLLLIFLIHLGIYSLILAPVLMNGSILVYFILRYNKFFRFSFDKFILSNLWVYGGPLMITGLVNVGLALSDRYVIKLFFSDREVGIYSNAYDWSEKFFKIFAGIFALTIQTYLMQVWHENRENYNRMVKTFTRYYYAAFIPLIFIVDIVLDFMFNNILNKAYLEGRNFILVILIAMFFDGLTNIANRGFAVHKKTVYLRNVALVAAIVNIALNFIFMRRFGYMTAAYTTLAGYVLYVFLIYIYSKKKINWKWEFYDKSIITTTAYWLAGYIIMRLIPSYPAKLSFLVIFCIPYLFIMPEDIRELLLTYSKGFIRKLSGK